MNKFIFFSIFSFVFLPYIFAQDLKSSCINAYLEKNINGPHLYYDIQLNSSNPTRPRSIEEIDLLKIYGQNFENLGVFEEIEKETITENGQPHTIKVIHRIEKSVKAKASLARRIKLVNPDILIATEVKDIESANDYARDYLDSQYNAILIEGNDLRGIDICFFVKKDLPFDFEVQSYKNFPTSSSDPHPIFSRDFPVLYIRPAGSLKSSAPLMAVIGTHYKSQMGDTPDKPDTFAKRSAQVIASAEILSQIRNRYSNLPIIVGGDFNKDVRTGEEFKPFYMGNFKDSMNFDPHSPPLETRGTQYFVQEHFPKEEDPYYKFNVIFGQLDMLMVNPIAGSYIQSTGIQRDVDEQGNERPFPKSKKDVTSRASDHDGVFAVIDFSKMYRNHISEH